MAHQQKITPGPGIRMGSTVGALAIILGVVLQLIPDFMPNQFPGGIGLLVGISLTIIGLQWDIFVQLKTTTDRQDRTAKLMAALETGDLPENPLIVIIHSAGRIMGMRDTCQCVVDDITRRITLLADELKELEGHRRLALRGEAHLMEYANALTRATRHSIVATSAYDGVDVEFWHSPVGEDYLANQKDMVKNNNVTIRRVFLVQKEDLVPPGSTKLMQIIRSHEAPPRIEVGLLVDSDLPDVIVFDEDTVLWTEMDSRGQGVMGGHVDLRDDQARKTREKIMMSWPRAQKTLADLRNTTAS